MSTDGLRRRRPAGGEVGMVSSASSGIESDGSSRPSSPSSGTAGGGTTTTGSSLGDWTTGSEWTESSDEEEELVHNPAQPRDIAHLFFPRPHLTRAHAQLRAHGIHNVAALAAVNEAQLNEWDITGSTAAEVLRLAAATPTPRPTAPASPNPTTPTRVHRPKVSLRPGTTAPPAQSPIQFHPADEASSAQSTPAGSPTSSTQLINPKARYVGDRYANHSSCTGCHECEEEDVDDASNYACPICLALLVNPVTLLCGHTLCRRCCAMAFQLSSKCPAGCGRLLPPYLPEVNTVLRSKLERTFPDEYELRREEVVQQEKTRPVQYHSFFTILPHKPPSSFPGLQWVYMFFAVGVMIMTLEAYMHQDAWHANEDPRAGLFYATDGPQLNVRVPSLLLAEHLVSPTANMTATWNEWGTKDMLFSSCLPWAHVLSLLPHLFAMSPMLAVCVAGCILTSLTHIVRSASLMVKSRILIGYSNLNAFGDMLAVTLVAALCNAVIGSQILPFTWTVSNEALTNAAKVVPIIFPVLFESVVGPPFTAFLYTLAQAD